MNRAAACRSIRVEDLTVAYGEKTVLRGFTAEFGPGITCLTGPSGAGKTTLLHVLAGLVRPQGGRIVGTPPCEKPILMFQDDRLFPWMTALENVAVACRDADKARVWLKRMELSGEERAYPASLSGGMRRRVALARALACETDLLLLDEPFKGMDPPLIARLLVYLRPLTEREYPVIISVHSPQEQELFGGRTVQVEKLQ